MQRLRENVRQMTRDEIHRLRQRQEHHAQQQQQQQQPGGIVEQAGSRAQLPSLQGADGGASHEVAMLATEAEAAEDADVDADRPWRIEQVPHQVVRDFAPHRAQPDRQTETETQRQTQRDRERETEREADDRHVRDRDGSGGGDDDDDVVELGTFKGAVKVDHRSLPPTPRAGLQQEQEADGAGAVGAGLRGGGGDDSRYVTLFAAFDAQDSERRYPSRALAAQVTG